MYALLAVFALTLVYLLAQELCRRLKLSCLLAIFGLLPLVLTPIWLQSRELDWFLWIKIYSVMFCICWGSCLRFTSLANSIRLRPTIPLLLAANILEATIVDALNAEWTHRLNAVTGVMLIASLPYTSDRTRIETASNLNDLRFDASMPWIVGYTIWNWTFVYLNYASFTGHHTAILAAALLVAIIDRHRWVQARACTLGLSLIPTATNYSGMRSLLNTTNWFDENLALFVGLSALLWMIASVRINLAMTGCQLNFIRRKLNGAQTTAKSLEKRGSTKKWVWQARRPTSPACCLQIAMSTPHPRR
jgi:hypothetical protein